MLLMFRFLVVLLIFFGLFQAAGSQLKIKSEFLPFFVVCMITLIVFLSGLLNVMLETTWLIAVLSIGYIYFHWKSEKQWVPLKSPGMSFFFFGSLILAVLLRGNWLSAYDDFSHWGLVAREMIILDRMPNFSDSLISFQAYPTGAASFIYFIGKILGNSEAIMLWAQSIVLLSGVTPLFVFVKNKNKALSTILMLYAIYLLFSNNGVNTLYVDTILTSISIGIVAIIYYYIESDEDSNAWLPLILGNSMLITVKNSGLLFTLINTFIFILLKKHRKLSVKEIGLLASPLLFKVLWDKHVDLVFMAGESTKHSMSLSYLSEILGGKNFQDIVLITRMFMVRSLNFLYADVTIVLFIVGFLLVRIKGQQGAATSEKKLLKLILGIYGVYQIGLWLTYILSMPLAEAITLASYTRYNMTLSVFLLGIFLIYYIVSYRPIKKEILSLVVSMSLLFLTIINPILTLFDKENAVASVRKDLAEIYSENTIHTDQPVYVYIANLRETYQPHFLTYQFKYQLRNDDIHLVESNTLGKLYSLKGVDSTVVVLVEDDMIHQQLATVGLSKESNTNIISRRVE